MKTIKKTVDLWTDILKQKQQWISMQFIRRQGFSIYRLSLWTVNGSGDYFPSLIPIMVVIVQKQSDSTGFK